MKTNLITIAILAMGLPVLADAPKTYPPPPQFQETKAEHEARMKWFRDAHFGMFIHWGLYSELAGEWKDKTVGGGAEWIQNSLAIPSSEYSTLARTFNPVKFNAEAWIKLMERAGVKYIAITTKHHDGFCLWPTKLNSDWNITQTPFKRDPMKELSEACSRHNVRFGIYHSIPDWHHPDWPGRPGFNDHAKGAPDKERYKYEYLFPQLKELLTQYGKVNLLWLDDGGMARPPLWNEKDGTELENFIRTVDRTVVMDDRSQAKPFTSLFSHGGSVDAGPSAKYANHAGDYITPEGAVPATGLPGIDWETCQTMQLPNNWGYNRLTGFRPFKDLLRQLVDVTSKGGNMLLNIGPDSDGEIVPQARRCLEKFADWMSVNAESIHGTLPSPFEQLPFDGRCTQKNGLLYLHVFTWPQDGTLVAPISNKVKHAWLLVAPRKEHLPVKATARGIEIALPATAPDPINSVVAVEIDGAVQVVSMPKRLSLGKPVVASSVWTGREKELNKSHVTDGRAETIWAAGETARSATLTVDLEAEYQVSEVTISDAPYGRTQSFDVEAQIGGEWKKICGGTTIGPDLRLGFEPVKARSFRLNIRQASDTPVVAEFQLLGN